MVFKSITSVISSHPAAKERENAETNNIEKYPPV